MKFNIEFEKNSERKEFDHACECLPLYGERDYGRKATYMFNLVIRAFNVPVVSKSYISSRSKSDLVEWMMILMKHFHERGEFEFCRIVQPVEEPAERERKLSMLLKAYKRKVDELMPGGEVFNPYEEEECLTV